MMKRVFSKKFECNVIIPEDCVEALDSLEEFLLATDFSDIDDYEKSIKSHFALTRKQIRGFHK